MNNKIRKDCFWYRPWKDMSATIDQCDLAETAKCPCDGTCDNFIHKNVVDRLIYKVIQTPFHNQHTAEWIDYYNNFKCTHCGFELDGEFPYFEMDLPNYMPAYCPKCGFPMYKE